jgi:hypothetical protein
VFCAGDSGLQASVWLQAQEAVNVIHCYDAATGRDRTEELASVKSACSWQLSQLR